MLDDPSHIPSLNHQTQRSKWPLIADQGIDGRGRTGVMCSPYAPPEMDQLNRNQKMQRANNETRDKAEKYDLVINFCPRLCVKYGIPYSCFFCSTEGAITVRGLILPETWNFVWYMNGSVENWQLMYCRLFFEYVPAASFQTVDEKYGKMVLRSSTKVPYNEDAFHKRAYASGRRGLVWPCPDHMGCKGIISYAYTACPSCGVNLAMFDLVNKVMIVPNCNKGSTNFTAFSMIREQPIASQSRTSDRTQVFPDGVGSGLHEFFPRETTSQTIQALTCEQIYSELRSYTSQETERSVMGIVNQKIHGNIRWTMKWIETSPNFRGHDKCSRFAAGGS